MKWLFILLVLSVLSCESTKKVCDREVYKQYILKHYYRCEKCGDIHKYK